MAGRGWWMTRPQLLLPSCVGTAEQRETPPQGLVSVGITYSAADTGGGRQRGGVLSAAVEGGGRGTGRGGAAVCGG